MFSTMLSLLGSLRRGNFVTNSLRFRSSASAYLSKTFGGAGNTTTSTWSGWVKRGSLTTPVSIAFWAAGTGVGNNVALFFTPNDQLSVAQNFSSVNTIYRTSNAVYRDPSAWYHIVFVLDTNNPADQNRARIWVNGVEITSWAVNTTIPSGTTFLWNANTAVHALGSNYSNAPTQYFDGYLTEVHFIDGQALTPSSFGQIESTTGVWSPKQYVGTYGANGFYLKFSDASAATAAAIGKDSSGNGHNWTPSGISVTPGVSYDSMLDVPANYSDGGNGRGNYAVLNPLAVGTSGTSSFPEANLSISGNGTIRGVGTIELPTSGKWYFEVSGIGYGNSGSAYVGVGSTVSQMPTAYCVYQTDGTKNISGSVSAYGLTWGGPTTGSNTDVIGVAVDQGLSTITFYKNNVSQGSINITIGSTLYPIIGKLGVNTGIMRVNFGQRPFNTATGLPPAGFLALNTQNMPTPAIVNGANYIAATAYTGTAGVQSLSNVVNGVSFQPDFVWIKSRTPDTSNHALFDSVRGTGKYLSSNTTGEEVANANTLTAFNSNGFSIGTDTGIVNANGTSYIAWQWKESVTAGLDIVSYTGNGAASRPIAHNLGVAPTFIIVKRLQVAGTSFQVRHPSIAVGNTMRLNLTDEFLVDATIWGGSLANTSNFFVGSNPSVNDPGSNYIAYCFASIQGFSRFSNYTGNGNVDGPFVYCGFKPKFVMYKSFSTGSSSNWQIFDSTRDAYNIVSECAAANVTSVVPNGQFIDLLSNGFKLRTNSNSHNGLNVGFIFVAFAEVPSKYALAR